jgi:hypothetical protein
METKVRLLNHSIIALSMFVTSTAALAQESAAPAADAPAVAAALDVKLGKFVTTADGLRVGRIDRIQADKDGKPASVAIIYQSRFVFVPVSTLSAQERGYVTSLTRKDVATMK